MIISGQIARLGFTTLIYKQKNFFLQGRKTVLHKPLKVKVNLSSKKGIAVVTWDIKDEFQIYCLTKGFTINEKCCAHKTNR